MQFAMREKSNRLSYLQGHMHPKSGSGVEAIFFLSIQSNFGTNLVLSYFECTNSVLKTKLQLFPVFYAKFVLFDPAP